MPLALGIAAVASWLESLGWESPVHSCLRAGRMSFANAAVIKRSVEFEVLAVNTLDDEIDASPAVVGDELLLKGKTYLYCIAAQN